MAQSPTEPPRKFAYSNVGYGLLGTIIERTSGQSYEDFLRAKIFVPLGLKTAGFGALPHRVNSISRGDIGATTIA